MHQACVNGSPPPFPSAGEGPAEQGLPQPSERNPAPDRDRHFPLDETRLFVTEVPRHLPLGRNGRPVHPLTVLRWIRQGVRGVRLEALKLGGRWVTSKEALARFMARLSNPSETASPPVPTAVASRGATHYGPSAEAEGP